MTYTLIDFKKKIENISIHNYNWSIFTVQKEKKTHASSQNQ